jgi:hypothetical protein
MTGRHVQILNLLLDKGELSFPALTEQTQHLYTVGNPQKALVRDLNYLLGLGAMRVRRPVDDATALLSVDEPGEPRRLAFGNLVGPRLSGRLEGLETRRARLLRATEAKLRSASLFRQLHQVVRRHRSTANSRPSGL